MNCRRITGSAVVDYIDTTAGGGLVVGLGLFAIYDSGNLSKFFAASSGMEINGGSASIGEIKNSGALVSGGSTSVDSASGLPASVSVNATISCSGDSCSIDLGDYVLDGIPENFADYIEASGPSGGTMMLATLLNKLADESDLPKDQVNLIKKLANIGHDMAKAEKGIENVAYDYETGLTIDSDILNTYVDQLNGDLSSSAKSEFQLTLSSVKSLLSSSSDTEAQLINQMIGVLAGEIDAMASEMYSNSSKLNLGTAGEEMHASVSATSILNPDTSGRTDIDSALICATGNGQDQGYNCE